MIRLPPLPLVSLRGFPIKTIKNKKSHTFLFLLRLVWTKDGWMDTSEWEDLWDDDAYYAHLDDLDFD